jgi:hypothetical protein
MVKEYITCSRKCNGSGWDNEIEIFMYGGENSSMRDIWHSQSLTIEETKKLISDLQKLVNMG